MNIPNELRPLLAMLAAAPSMPDALVVGICYTFEKFGNKSIFKITRKEKK